MDIQIKENTSGFFASKVYWLPKSPLNRKLKNIEDILLSDIP